MYEFKFILALHCICTHWSAFTQQYTVLERNRK